MFGGKKLFLSFGGIGFIPFAPGTFGTAVGLLVIVALEKFAKIPHDILIFGIVLAAIFLTFIAIPLIKSVTRGHDVDQSWIVIDEVVGIMITILPFLFFAELTLLHILVAFGMFRFFDILKPIGIKSIDNRKTPSSVMLDDIVAGVYAMIGGVLFMQILNKVVA